MQDQIWFDHVESKIPKRSMLARMDGTGRLNIWIDGVKKYLKQTNNVRN